MARHLLRTTTPTTPTPTTTTTTYYLVKHQLWFVGLEEERQPPLPQQLKVPLAMQCVAGKPEKEKKKHTSSCSRALDFVVHPRAQCGTAQCCHLV